MIFSNFMFNTLTSGLIHAVCKKTAGLHVALRGNSPLLYGLRTWSQCQKTQQVLEFALEKFLFGWGLQVFCE